MRPLSSVVGGKNLVRAFALPVSVLPQRAMRQNGFVAFVTPLLAEKARTARRRTVTTIGKGTIVQARKFYTGELSCTRIRCAHRISWYTIPGILQAYFMLRTDSMARAGEDISMA